MRASCQLTRVGTPPPPAAQRPALRQSLTGPLTPAPARRRVSGRQHSQHSREVGVWTCAGYPGTSPRCPSDTLNNDSSAIAELFLDEAHLPALDAADAAECSEVTAGCPAPEAQHLSSSTLHKSLLPRLQSTSVSESCSSHSSEDQDTGSTRQQEHLRADATLPPPSAATAPPHPAYQTESTCPSLLMQVQQASLQESLPSDRPRHPAHDAMPCMPDEASPVWHHTRARQPLSHVHLDELEALLHSDSEDDAEADVDIYNSFLAVRPC